MPAKVLLIGGSGFVSGTLARTAMQQGHQVWAVTRGQRPMPDGVQAIVADRKEREAFARAIAAAGVEWDLVVDCIGFQPEDAQQDIEVLTARARHLVFISTDFIFDPAHRRLPQNEETQYYAQSGYGGGKRRCEEVFLSAASGAMNWTVLRPCHIYGPGSLLGCLPEHGRDKNLIAHLRAQKPLTLVGGGYFLQQPIFAADLAKLCLSCLDNAQTHQQIFCAAGPDIIESRSYYEIIAGYLGVTIQIEELPVDTYLHDVPGSAPFLCHRIYDVAKLRASGVAVPATPIAEGLQQHVDSLRG
jgi:nucleoside-diphosphate-sugar epimerase